MAGQKTSKILASFLIFSSSLFFSQTTSIKVRKDLAIDSLFYDATAMAFYSKNSGFENRFKTLKHCRVSYESKKHSGTTVLNSNKLPYSITDLFYKKTKKITIRFTDIILKADSLNKDERKSPSIIWTITRRRDFHMYFGASGKIPFPIPIWRTTSSIMEYGP